MLPSDANMSVRSDKSTRLPRRTRGGTTRRVWGFRILASCLPIVLLLLLGIAAEVIGRVAMYLKYGVPGKSYGIYQADPELGATHRPNSYNSNSVINNWGFRNRDDISAQKPAGATRIYCSGGSTTFCYNLGVDEAWPSVLQSKLRALPGHANDEVLNAGQIGWSICHEFALAKRLLPVLKPDYVVLFTGVNEGMSANQFGEKNPQLLDQFLAEQKWGVVAAELDQARFWKRHSLLVRFWDYRIKSWIERSATAQYRSAENSESQQSSFPGHPYVMSNLEHTLRSYIAFIREQNAEPIVLRFGDNGSDGWYLRDHIRTWRECAVRVGREEGVTICDVASTLESHPRRQECFLDTGVHVTALGAEVVADTLLATLRNMPGKSPESVGKTGPGGPG